MDQRDVNAAILSNSQKSFVPLCELRRSVILFDIVRIRFFWLRPSSDQHVAINRKTQQIGRNGTRCFLISVFIFTVQKGSAGLILDDPTSEALRIYGTLPFTSQTNDHIYLSIFQQLQFLTRLNFAKICKQ